MSELTAMTLAELRGGLDKKSFSAVDLTDACLKQIEAHKELNCFLTTTRERALAAAREADRLIGRGVSTPLLGIPVAVKDNILTKGVPSTCASRILHNFIPPYDATVTRKLASAGAVTIGKTNLDEFAMGSSNENSACGPVLNPWNPRYVPGGTSGGSAAAVAARMVPAALGTDTGGSIRQPASFCGLVGIKPTYGRVSRYGVIAYASSLDQVGALGRTVRDCALVLQAISGRDQLDATSVEQPVPDFAAGLGASIKGLRVGVPTEYFAAGLDPEVEAAVREAIAALERSGAVVVDISLPHTHAAVAAYYVIAPAEASSNLSRYDGIRYGYRASQPLDLRDLYCRSRSEAFGTEVKRRILIGTFVLSSGYYEAYYLRAQKVRTLIARDFREAFENRCDLIACPTAPTTAFRLGEKIDDPVAMYLSDVFTLPASLAGLPGLSLPCGMDRHKLPIGLQLIGRPWDEQTLLKAAGAYESETPWHRMTPPIFHGAEA